MKVIDTNLAPKAVGTYSQGIEVGGVYYFSGQVGINPETNNLQDGFEAQLNQILANIDGLLKASDLTRKNIVKTSIFLTDLNNFSLVNTAYQNYFQAPYPARSTVQVSALPKGAVIEIEVIASR